MHTFCGGAGRTQGPAAGSRQARSSPVPTRDHDDDVSLVEACRKLNEVIGLKGMGRYDCWDLSTRHPCPQLGHGARRAVGPQEPSA